MNASPHSLIRRSSVVAALLAALIGAYCPAAEAQVRVQARGSDLDYEFPDADRLGGDPSSPYGSMLKQRPLKPARVLFRPRTSFVAALLDSVEDV